MEEQLRREVWRLERELTLYGFDNKRGIETYNISEIKKVLKALSQKDAKDAKKLLRDLVRVQRTLYDELYKMAGATEMSVDTHMPESKLREIEAWLEGPQKGRHKVEMRFAEAVMEVLKTIKRGRDAEALTGILLRLYKRNYDRFRVLDFLASACEEMGAKIKRPLPESLRDASEALLASTSALNLDDIVKTVERRLKA
jgi:hypothetical protein